jgi:hypothetical protein
VLKFFPSEDNWFLGQIDEARPPEPDVADDQGWMFHVTFEDGDHGDYSRARIEADLVPEGSANKQDLHGQKEWQVYKKIYDIVRSQLLKDTFGATNDACMRTVFRMHKATDITVARIKAKYNKAAKLLHDDKVRGQPARVRHLAKLVLAAAQYLQQSHEHLSNSSVSVNDKPTPEDYHEYNSEGFAKAASTATETVKQADLTQPDAPGEGGGGGGGDDNDNDDDDDEAGEEAGDHSGDGSDGPWDGDGSDYGGNYPNSPNAVNTHKLQDFILSPFQHVPFVPKACIEQWAIAYNTTTRTLIEAINSTGPGRTKRIGTAARWYLGLPQLLLRDANRSPKRNAKVIRRRLSLYNDQKYDEILNHWYSDCSKARAKMKPPKRDTPERRLEHTIDLFHKGYVSRGLATLEGNGRAAADDPAIQKQMFDKHPQIDGNQSLDDEPPPAVKELELQTLDQVVKRTRGLVGVGPRGLKAGHIKPLESGAFGDDNAKEAFASFEALGILYLDCRMPRWLRRALNGGLLTPLIKKPAAEGETPDARPTNAREMDVASWTKALQRGANAATRAAVLPQQLAVAVSGGCHIKIIGAKLLLEVAIREGKRYVHVALDLKNAHNSYDRRGCQDAINEAAQKNPDLIPLARAHHADCGQASEVFMRVGHGQGLLNGFKRLCASFVGGPQGSALTNLAFPLRINAALKATEQKFNRVTVRAIQDDCDLMGDPDQIFGTDGNIGALQFLLDELKKSGLEPNLTKFQVYATPPAVESVPAWLERPFIITNPVEKLKVAAANAEAEAAAAKVKNAADDEKLAAKETAKAAAKAAKEAVASVAEHDKAYGVKICGAALGDEDYELEFLREKSEEITEAINSVSSKIAANSAQCASTAIYYSLQCRADFLLETHLPSLTRDLARAVDDALRGAYTRAFGVDILDPDGQTPGEADPTFLRDLAGLKAKAGGCGFRNTERRAVFLNTLNNVLPQMVGTDTPGLWPALATILGADSFKKGNEEARWEVFLSSESKWAQELESEIERVKALRQSALAAAGRSTNAPASEVFDAPTEGFGNGVKKLHRQLFDDIRGHEAKAMGRRASQLPRDDQRKLAFEQSSECRFSNVLFVAMPSQHTRFTNNEFHTAVQSVMGAPLSLLKPAIGLPIKSTTNGPTPKVDPFGNNLKKLKAALGGGTTRNHNSFVDRLSFWLGRGGVSHRGGNKGKPQTCKDLFNRVNANNCEEGEEGQRDLQEIIPDLVIDGRFLSPSLDGPGAALLRGVRTLVDVKTKSCCAKYAAAQGVPAAVVKKRQKQVNDDYHKRAAKLDEKLGTTAGSMGPFKKELNRYGQKGRVAGPVVGAFAEASSDTYAIADLVASALAQEHCSYYSEKPSVAKAVFTEQLYRSLGLTARLGWARLLVGRYRGLVQVPTTAGQHTGGSCAPHHFTPDDEDAYDHGNFFNPGSTRHYSHRD